MKPTHSIAHTKPTIAHCLWLIEIKVEIKNPNMQIQIMNTFNVLYVVL